MPKANKIAISLPEEMLKVIEKERTDSGESRSQFLRRAVELLLRFEKEQKRSYQYSQSYQEIPETQEEIEAARHSAAAILSKEAWL